MLSSPRAGSQRSVVRQEGSQKPGISAKSKVKVKVKSGVRPARRTQSIDGCIKCWSQAVRQVQKQIQKNCREAQIQKDMEMKVVRILGIMKNSAEAKVGEVGRSINIIPLP